MTGDSTTSAARTRVPGPWRKTAVLLAAWILGAVALGVPGNRASQASAEVRSAPAPKIVHSGPECLAGQGAAPPATKQNRAKD